MQKEILNKITEDDFLSQVIDLAHICHWRVAHFRPAMTKWGWRTAVSADGAGFPDCVMVKVEPKPRVIFAELKTDAKTSQPTFEQYGWLYALQSVGGVVECYLWRPSDLQEIIDILKG